MREINQSDEKFPLFRYVLHAFLYRFPLHTFRINISNILAICFLQEYKKPTICVLHQSKEDTRYIKIYNIDVNMGELIEENSESLQVEAGANMLIPISLPLGKVLTLLDNLLENRENQEMAFRVLVYTMMRLSCKIFYNILIVLIIFGMNRWCSRSR